MEYSKLQNVLFFIIAKSDPSFTHLDIVDKFLYILSSKNNTCTIAKFIYKMYTLRCNLLLYLLYSPTLSQPQCVVCIYLEWVG